ncbi:MAG: hypothetical protein M1561_04435 [Gammaproteobacteria bacterium]|nr:hypothetical protein [Gammaproteobacteria bacterium]
MSAAIAELKERSQVPTLTCYQDGLELQCPSPDLAQNVFNYVKDDKQGMFCVANQKKIKFSIAHLDGNALRFSIPDQKNVEFISLRLKTYLHIPEAKEEKEVKQKGNSRLAFYQPLRLPPKLRLNDFTLDEVFLGECIDACENELGEKFRDLILTTFGLNPERKSFYLKGKLRTDLRNNLQKLVVEFCANNNFIVSDSLLEKMLDNFANELINKALTTDEVLFSGNEILIHYSSHYQFAGHHGNLVEKWLDEKDREDAMAEWNQEFPYSEYAQSRFNQRNIELIALILFVGLAAKKRDLLSLCLLVATIMLVLRNYFFGIGNSSLKSMVSREPEEKKSKHNRGFPPDAKSSGSDQNIAPCSSSSCGSSSSPSSHSPPLRRPPRRGLREGAEAKEAKFTSAAVRSGVFEAKEALAPMPDGCIRLQIDNAHCCLYWDEELVTKLFPKSRGFSSEDIARIVGKFKVASAGRFLNTYDRGEDGIKGGTGWREVLKVKIREDLGHKKDSNCRLFIGLSPGRTLSSRGVWKVFVPIAIDPYSHRLERCRRDDEFFYKKMQEHQAEIAECQDQQQQRHLERKSPC